MRLTRRRFIEVAAAASMLPACRAVLVAPLWVVSPTASWAVGASVVVAVEPLLLQATAATTAKPDASSAGTRKG